MSSDVKDRTTVFLHTAHFSEILEQKITGVWSADGYYLMSIEITSESGTKRRLYFTGNEDSMHRVRVYEEVVRADGKERREL